MQINNDNYTAVLYDDKQESFAYFNVQPLRERKATDTFFNDLSKILSRQGLKKVKEASNNKQYSHGAIAGIYQGNSGSSGPVRAQLIAFAKEGSGYYIFGITKKEEFENLQPKFESMINELSFISPQEASKIDPPRMGIHQVIEGETWDSITSRYFKTSN